MAAIQSISHIAVNTADLDRYRRFYEGILGLPMGAMLRLGGGPRYRHAVFHLDGPVVLHVFEVPGYDPQADGIGPDFGQRGRVDHFGFQVGDRAALQELADRLRVAGASDGVVRPLGPVFSVWVTDPDGLQLEVNCPNPGWDPASDPDDVLLEVGTADWLDRLLVTA